MSRTWRVLIAFVLIFLGATIALFFGGQVAMCLGPLGVTAVQCAKATGMIPGVGLTAPIFVSMVAAAAFVLAPIAPTRPSSWLVAVIAALTGAVGYVLLRPRTMEGPTSSGEWISIELLIDPFALTTVAIIVATVATLAWAHLISPAIVRLRAVRP